MLFLHGQNDSILPVPLTKRTESDRFHLHLLLSKTAKQRRLPAATSHLVEENIAFSTPKHCFLASKSRNVTDKKQASTAKNWEFYRQKVHFLPIRLRILPEKPPKSVSFLPVFFCFKCKDFAINLSMSGLQKIVPFFPTIPAFGPKKAILGQQKRQSVKMTNASWSSQIHSSSMPQR